jgi:hypothetical protein
LRMLRKHQFHQRFTAQSSQIILGHRDPILPNFAQIA